MNKSIFKIILFLFILSFIIALLSIYSKITITNNKITMNKMNETFNYKKELISNLSNYIKNKNIVIDKNTIINSDEVLNSDLCDGSIFFDIKSDFTLHNINLSCNEDANQNIKSFSINDNSTIQNIISIDNGYLIISYDNKQEKNYIYKVDNNFETKWKNELTNVGKPGKYKYKGYLFENNRYYIVFNYEIIDESKPSALKDNMALITVDKNGYNYKLHFMMGLDINYLSKIVNVKDKSIIYNSDGEYIIYDTENETYDRYYYSQLLDYNHEKMIDLYNNVYYTYDQIYKIMYKYASSDYIIREYDLKNLTKDNKYVLLFDEYKPFLADNKLFIGYTELDSENNYTYFGIYVLDLDFNLIKDLKFSDTNYDISNYFDVNDKVKPKYNKIVDAKVIEDKLYIYSNGEFEGKEFPTINIVSLNDYSVESKVLNSFGKDNIKVLKYEKDKVSFYNVIDNMAYIIEYKY